jgi:hypothetical protein
MRRKLSCGILYFVVAIVRSAEPVDTWIAVTPPAGLPALKDVAFGNGVFVLTGFDGAIATSTNGLTWSQQNAGTTNTFWGGVKFVNGRFFARGEVQASATAETFISANGTNWTKITGIGDITYGLGAYWAYRPSAEGVVIARSLDLQNWETVQTQGYTPDPPDPLLEFGNGTFLGIRTRAQRSDDGINWETSPFIQSSFITPSDISFQNGTFFISGVNNLEWRPANQILHADYHVLAFSPDARNWTLAYSNRTANSSRIGGVAIGGRYYVTSTYQSILYTTNLTGGAWTTVNLAYGPYPGGGGGNHLKAVAFGNQVFVALAGSAVYRSNPVEGGFAPVIQTQPVNVSALVGGTAQLEVKAHGSEPMSFQWRKDGASITGATDARLIITNATLQASGEYDVVVSNEWGTVTSDKVILRVSFTEVHSYAGVTLHGNPADRFLIEYQNELMPGPWQNLTNVTLQSRTFIWIDYDSPNHPKRFYRATFQTQ